MIRNYIFGELKNPLVYKNIAIPIRGPIPKIKSTNFAEFFFCPKSCFFIFDFVWTFLDFFFFMKNILLHRNLKNSMIFKFKYLFI